MKKDKRLVKLLHLLVEQSFDKSGKLNQKLAYEFSKKLSRLPSSKAIFALSEYKKLLQKRIEQNILYIESAIQLSKTEIDQIIKKLTSSFLILNSTFKLNSSLLGGVRLKIADTVIDDSLKRKAQQLGEQIKWQT